MKRCVAVVLLAMSVLGLCGCQKESTPSDLEGSITSNVCVPSVMHDGDVYCTTGRQLPCTVAPEAYVGEITSTVPASQWPEENGQANFDGLGEPFAVTSDGFLVLFEHEWTLFEKREP